MRPYLSIIRDSFHEALVSRVLWILLAIITLILLALVPLGFIEEAGSYLADEDIVDRRQLVRKILAQGESQEPSPGRRIWELLDDSNRRLLSEYDDASMGRRRTIHRLVESLRDMLTQDDFYRAEDWAKVRLPKAARDLQTQGLENLPQDQLARFNRLALDAAFPEEIAPIPPTQVQLAYFHWELGLTLPVKPEQLFPAINQLLVATLAILLGVAGVFVAVIVTSSMIPQTFDAGSIDLLLSKPITRAGLFLAKFVGGCAFIAINAVYLIGGLWLILGVRFGLWNERLLLAVPLYLFLFAIYYGVSSLAGVVWRNAIVSVVMAVLFWFACWVLGTANDAVEQLALNPRRIVTIVPAGKDLIAANTVGEVFRWDEVDSDWQPVFVARSNERFPFDFGRSLVGPVYDPQGERILAFERRGPGFSPLGGSTRLLVGKRAEDWRRDEGVNMPDGAMSLLLGPGDKLFAASAQGIYRLEGDLEARQEDINIFGVRIPLPEQGGRFVNVGPDVQFRPPQSAAIDADTGDIVLFDGFRLVRFEADDEGTYREAAEATFDVKLTGEVAITGGDVYLALDGEVRRYDAELALVETVESVSRSNPGSMTVSPDGRVLAVLYRDGDLWTYDCRAHEPLAMSITGQGDVSSVAFDGSTMYVADRVTRITQYELADDSVIGRRQGALPLAERIYRYALHPLYTIFPKPGQLNETVMYVLSSNDTQLGALRLDDGGNGPQRLDVWGPIWSNLVFLAVVLAAACVYIYRKDF